MSKPPATEVHTTGLDDEVAALFPDVDSGVARRLIASAVRAFAERGYHATTTRHISEGAGLSPAALYVHFTTKEAVLHEVSRVGHLGVLDAIRTAAAAEPTPPQRMRALVRAFTSWHVEYHTFCRVAQYEIAALTEEHYAEIADIRRDTERFVRREIQAGVDSGDFTVPTVATAARAILSMGIDVARWYHPGRSTDPDRLVAEYADLAAAMLGVQG
ncbi:TetR/AcrR family transcriptional regulator [Rhodococcus sp. NPDC003318]|uniref:TetR/AcrR family transcriptional regulator n=1 Tax=Rhodococcus sp. NPDC003318 TaxID=3364503 RepID=UPI0036757834